MAFILQSKLSKKLSRNSELIKLKKRKRMPSKWLRKATMRISATLFRTY